MRFVLIDRILDVQRGESLAAVKNLSLAEEYLSDHFPGFPVMPGVLMLEALTQAGAWLIRDMEDFAHSIIVLKQAKTIKYGSFVEPGRQLELRVNLISHDDRERCVQGRGRDRRPGDGQGPHHLDAIQLARSRSRIFTRPTPTIVAGLRDLYADAPKRLGRRPSDRAAASGAGGQAQRLRATKPARLTDSYPTHGSQNLDQHAADSPVPGVVLRADCSTRRSAPPLNPPL